MTLQDTHSALYKRLEVRTGEMLVNMGPHHPSTHGVINFMVETDGEVMTRAVPDVGYLHRSIEKIAEKVGYTGFMPYTDRIDYLASMFANHGWAMAVEKLLGVEVPRRALYMRVIADELNRIANHLVTAGAMAMDIGAVTPFPYVLREREYVNDLIEELCGARLTYNYVRVGGVAWDMPDGWAAKVTTFLDHFEKVLPEFDRLITYNEIYIRRTSKLCVIPAEMAIQYSLSGPNLRASGVSYDVRRDHPYAAYPELEFDIPVGLGQVGTVGDCWDRYQLRLMEMRQSVRILRQALAKIPEGPTQAKLPRKLKPEAGEACSRVESARGELQYYVISDGTENPYRARIRTGSFTSMGIIEPLSRGLMIADLVALIASFDVVAPEIDR